MKKYFLFILFSYLVIFILCATKAANVKVKAGVVMKTGDVKDVARQEFLLTKKDLVALWKDSKKEHMKDLKLIEDGIKAEIDYDKKLSQLENELNRYRKSRENRISPNSSEVNKIWHELHILLGVYELRGNLPSALMGISKEKGEIIVQFFKDYRDKYEDETSYGKAKECSIGIKLILEKIIEGSYSKEKEFWEKSLEDWKKVNNLINSIEVKLKDDDIAVLKTTDKINNLKEDFKSRTNEQFELNKNKAINAFQANLKENIVKAFKTNLNGEGLFTIIKGRYFLFGIAQIAQIKIIWNLLVNIEKKENYIELSNDNAFSIDDFNLVAELLDALEGVKSNFGKDN